MKNSVFPIKVWVVAVFAVVSEQQLKAATQTIGETQARLRNAHLRYHLQARAILQPSQIRRYAELRGYGADRAPVHHKHNQE